MAHLVTPLMPCSIFWLAYIPIDLAFVLDKVFVREKLFFLPVEGDHSLLIASNSLVSVF